MKSLLVALTLTLTPTLNLAVSMLGPPESPKY